ncbi:type II and III secretion system protein [Sulfurospirillum arcachonense]|uniref:type II and III secretion system protein n=1 Tax=Sulfurospirillum arcachonense TaxID=57666 RepID=UPI00046ABD5D|nr:type II and III secretion system protein [Sulfurospirillum arcachonense]
MKNIFINKKIITLLCVTLLISGCGMNTNNIATPNFNNIDDVISNIPTKNKISKLMKQGIYEIKNANYEKASKTFAEGLRLDPSNGHLHFLNALSYHMRSLSGNTKMLNLAQIGYSTALKFDNSNYWAAYLLGHIYFQKQEYLNAQNQFSYGLLFSPNNPYLLRALSVSSYYNNNIKLNSWSAKKAYELDPNNKANLRNLVFSQAASGKIEDAKKSLNLIKNATYLANDNTYMKTLSYDTISNRINDWENYYASADGSIFGDPVSTEDLLNNNDNGSYSSDDSYTNNGSNIQISKETGEITNLPKMTLVDVVIIQTEEIKSQSKGINLLDGLNVTLSGTLYNRNKSYGTNGTSDIITIGPDFRFDGLEYNLNIFNDAGNKAEVLARPSLLAIENQSSNFYSGSTLHVQLNSSDGDGSMEDVPVGISLNITPRFYKNDIVKVTVHAERSFLQSLSENVGFSAFSQTARTSVDATAVLKLGETLILSGLTVSSNDKSQSGVPLLQDIPAVQYLFSKKVDTKTEKSILILLTPRKAKYYNEVLDSKEVHKQNKKQTKHIKTLIKKEKIQTNIDAIIAQMTNNNLYQHFRTGDLQLEDWNNKDTFIGAIKRIAGFLYY